MINQLLAPLNETLEPLIKLGFGTPLNWTPGLVLLEVAGRKSGRLMRVPLVGFATYPFVTVSTVRSESQWIKNLRAASDPHVWVWRRRFAFEKTFVNDHIVTGRLSAAST